ncbi:hypothetical protein [Planctomonas deserti]|uniref:hypothetical protein n=1 Tax=Planctomonas deserti TaxID=2144185 RepID=UPI000D33930B|nr:hypothetical protein [Planctomonas deserti]
MVGQWKSVVPVWILGVVGIVLVAALAAPGDYLDWLPVVLGAGVIVTFLIQLALPRKTGFVGRAMLSVCGLVVLLALATAVLAAVSPPVG